MQISISAQHISIGNSLKTHVEERIKEVINKYFPNVQSCNVHFSKQNYQFICHLMLSTGDKKIPIIKTDANAAEVYASFNIALHIFEKQLRRYKAKIKKHHDNHKEIVNNFDVGKSYKAMKYVISPYEEELEEVTSLKYPTSDIQDNPIIIAEKPVTVMELSVSDAVMKMDLENLPALMFKNSKTKRINVVYYRKDGNISWVDSEEAHD